MKSKLILTSVLLVLLSFSVGWSQSSMSIDHVDGLHNTDTLATGQVPVFHIRMTNGADSAISGSTNGFRIYSETGATWGSTTGEMVDGIFTGLADQLFVNHVSEDGMGADTVGFGTIAFFTPGIGNGFNEIIGTITLEALVAGDHCGEICIDSSYYPPNAWLWSTFGGDVFPDWAGPHCFLIWDAATGTPCGGGGNNPPVLAEIGAQAVIANNTMSFSVTATDADSDPITLTFTNTDLPAGFNFTDNGDGTGAFDWTPGCAEDGVYSGTFTADDGTDTHDEIVTFTVVANAVPSWTVTTNPSVGECGTVNFTVSATDPEGGAVTYSAINVPAGATWTPATGVFDWTTGAGDAGVYTVTFTATDVCSGTADMDVIITVTANADPVWTATGNKSTAECGTFNFTVVATDDGGTPSYSAANVPAGATWTPATGVFDWTTGPGDAGVYTVTFTASDACGGSADDIVELTVTANGDPVWTATGPQTVAECSNLNFTVVATDDGGTPTYSVSGLPTGATFVGDTFDWTTGAGDAAGSPYTVTFTASDACGGTADDIVVITVTANGDPVWTATGPQTVAECSNLTFTVVATDDGGTPTYSVSGLPTGATFVGDTFDWTTGAGDAVGSPYTVTFTASDACGGTADDIVIITVDANQNPTVAAGIDIAVKECEAIAFTVTSSDPDGTTPTVLMSGDATTGTFDAGTGEFTWTPVMGEAGTYNVNFTATDDCGGSALDVIILTVTANAAPVLTADSTSVTIIECAVITFNVAATDVDDGFPAITMFEADESFVDNGDGTATLTGGPSHGDVATGDSLVFFATDACGAVDTLIIPLIIIANPSPLFGATADTTFTQGDTVMITMSATDSDAMVLTIDSSSVPEASTEWTFVDNTDGTGSFTWNSTFATPGGSHSIVFYVDDGCSMDTLTVLFDIATDVPGGKGSLPEVFSLSQNYPNPFNPSTSIKYSVGENSHVTLGVFNVLGQQIKTLVDERKSAGQYEVSWNAYSDNGVRVSSGIYFYKLVTDTYSETRKMILLK